MWNNQREENLKDIHDKMEEIEKLGTLRIWTLHVLEHGPKNGVEIMDAVEEHHERFHKMQEMVPHMKNHESTVKNVKISPYRPLPGSIYPMLKKMIAEDLVIKQPDGRYDITENGLKIVYRIFGNLSIPHDEINKEKAVENALIEIYKSLQYLEDIKKERLIPHKELIEYLNVNLKKIKDSMEKE